MENKVLIGTSGWGYDEWVGPFYPKNLSKEDYLSFYSEIFYTNEINTTFYNIPSKYIVENWVKKTPENFVFSAKIPKSITHECKLDINECLDDLHYFLRVMDPLIKSKKLLAFLLQLPPSFTKDDHFGILKEFIEHWPSDLHKCGYHLVLEFRDQSWMNDDVFNYLRKLQLTYCAVIEPLLPPRMDITNPKFAYIRFHGYGKEIWFDYFFKEEEIRKWSGSIRNVTNEAEKVGIYFNNHFSGYAAKNSLMMMRELGIKPRKDPNKVSLLEIKKKSGTYSKNQTGLDQFLK
ncbi:MAG: DUF72 domain-containing protein [Candidatus Thorarchaeota archaeon]